jgi:YjbR
MTSWASSPVLRRIRRICGAFAEVVEVRGPDAMAFRVRDRGFARYQSSMPPDPRPQLWCKAPPGAQEEMIAADPEVFFVPKYHGPFGWVGMFLDPPPDDWDELAAMLEVGYRLTAPRKLTDW